MFKKVMISLPEELHAEMVEKAALRDISLSYLIREMYEKTTLKQQIRSGRIFQDR